MRIKLNATACAELFESVNFGDTDLILTLSLLSLINIMVIVGNSLVIAAIYYSSKLRSITNLFIASLAVADLLVGILVLPFSSTWEVFKVWIFGDVWCQVWLAVDVWMCTASILNLCAISLDRYVAVTRPISYPSIMSHTRAKILIAGLWILSFVICFPPLVGWRDSKSESVVINGTTHIELPSCQWKCELTNETGYVVYSALGSFYVPMLVMLFFYWRIYRAAVRTTRAINLGFKTIKGSKAFRRNFNEQRVTLRIHRGTGTSRKPHRSHNNCNGSDSSTSTTVTPTTQGTYAVYYSVIEKDAITTNLSCHSGENHLRVQVSPKRPLPMKSNSCSNIKEISSTPPTSPNPTSEAGCTKPKIGSRRMGKRNIKAQVKRFRMETKAAKTLGIIVGGFIFCWLPFFTMYLVRAFCPGCIHPVMFSTLFWLGYCNSAINPLIYALFSKDFRLAFKRIICTCLGKKQQRESRRGSELQETQFRNRNYATQSHLLGEDSDPEAEESR